MAVVLPSVTRVLHTAGISNVEIIKCVVNNKDGEF